MKLKRKFVFFMIWALVMVMALPPGVFAQDAGGKPAFRQEELDQLLAPIALYPDSLLAQVLIASTYPLEVVHAERWARQHKDMKGDALAKALDAQPWDPSVKSLVSVPQVLTMMSEKLDWTQKLGDAFLAEQKKVMDTVQALRAKAQKEGNLKTTKEQIVTVEKEIIIIQPASPQVIYVPVYNPVVVYGVWAYPAYPPYPVYVYPPGAALFTFSMGVAVGAAWRGGGYNTNWNGGSINIDNSININNPGRRPSGGGGKAEQWKHNSEYRQGVAYRDTATRDKYSPTNRAAVDKRMDSRGYDKTGAGVADRTAGRQPAQVQDRTSQRSGSETKSRGSALSGMDRSGSATRDSGNRGAASRQSMQSGSRGGGGTGGRRSK